MKVSPIDTAKAVPCPACMVHGGEECWPRAEDDSNWVHTERRELMNLFQAQIAAEGPVTFVLG